MQKMSIIGHIGTEPTINEVNGKRVVNFSVAENQSFKNAQGVKETRTTWTKCDYWNCSDGLLPYLVKGSKIYVEGRPSAEAYTTKDGEIKANLCLSVREIELVGSKKEENNF